MRLGEDFDDDGGRPEAHLAVVEIEPAQGPAHQNVRRASLPAAARLRDRRQRVQRAQAHVRAFVGRQHGQRVPGALLLAPRLQQRGPAVRGGDRQEHRRLVGRRVVVAQVRQQPDDSAGLGRLGDDLGAERRRKAQVGARAVAAAQARQQVLEARELARQRGAERGPQRFVPQTVVDDRRGGHDGGGVYSRMRRPRVW